MRLFAPVCVLSLAACAHGTSLESLQNQQNQGPANGGAPASGGQGGGAVDPPGQGGAGGGPSGGAGGAGLDGGSGGSHTGGSGGGAPASCDDALDCQSCGDCALNQGACGAEASACGADPACMDFYSCVEPCFEQACFDACSGQYPGGASLYTAFVSCVVCGECPQSCGGC